MLDTASLSVRPGRCAKALRQAGYDPGPPQPFGPSGFKISLYHHARGFGQVGYGSVIVTQAEHDGIEWLHASIARADRMPDYADLVALKAATFGENREAYQVFPPAARHISIHDQALHLWGRADGQPVLPDFGVGGTI